MLSIKNIYLQLDEHIYNIVIPSCFTFNTKLLFNVKIQIFDTKIYMFTHIVPLPLNISHFIISPEFLAHANNTLYQICESCLKVEQELFCQKVHMDMTTKNRRCLSDIVKNAKETKCDVMDTGYEMNTFEAEKGFIFIFNGQNVTLKSTCYDETQLDGYFIVRYKNCTV